jgi:hypothetical protein
LEREWEIGEWEGEEGREATKQRRGGEQLSRSDGKEVSTSTGGRQSLRAPTLGLPLLGFPLSAIG